MENNKTSKCCGTIAIYNESLHDSSPYWVCVNCGIKCDAVDSTDIKPTAFKPEDAPRSHAVMNLIAENIRNGQTCFVPEELTRLCIQLEHENISMRLRLG